MPSVHESTVAVTTARRTLRPSRRRAGNAEVSGRSALKPAEVAVRSKGRGTRRAQRRRAAAGRAGSRLARRSSHHDALRQRPAVPRPSPHLHRGCLRRRRRPLTSTAGPGMCWLTTISPAAMSGPPATAFPPQDGVVVEQISVSPGAALVLVYVPPEPEELKPFLVQGAIVGGRQEGAYISIVRRRGEASIPITAAAIHSTLAAGRALLRLIGVGNRRRSSGCPAGAARHQRRRRVGPARPGRGDGSAVPTRWRARRAPRLPRYGPRAM
jgi:hypothetical protein